MTGGQRYRSADVTAAGSGSVTALPDLRDDDRAALTQAHEQEADTDTVSLRINARTVVDAIRKKLLSFLRQRLNITK